MFSGLTASALIGALGAALQVLAVATLVLSKLDEMILALRRVLGNATAETKSTHAAAKMTALAIKEDRLWATVTSAEDVADAALARAEDLREQASAAAERLQQQRRAVLSTLDGATKESS